MFGLFKLEFNDADTDTDTDILARILADTSETHDFLKLFPWQAERHADILATILARMSMSVSASWNSSFTRKSRSAQLTLSHARCETSSGDKAARQELRATTKLQV